MLSRVRLFVTPWAAARQTSLSITSSWNLLKLMSLESVMPSNHLILCRPLLLPPSILPSIKVFSNESALRVRWSKYWSSSFSISPCSERACQVTSVLSHSVRPLDCSLPGSSVHGILQAGTKERVAATPSKGSSRPRARMRSSCTSCAADSDLQGATPRNFRPGIWTGSQSSPRLLTPTSSGSPAQLLQTTLSSFLPSCCVLGSCPIAPKLVPKAAG
ncbi:hypothetical protein R6Z07F_008842 [Ovis aries]